MVVGLQPVTANTSVTGQISFKCELVKDAPVITATSSKWDNKPRQFIRWVSDVGASDGFTPLKRCQQVAPRLQSSFADGNAYITHGYKNRNPIICTTDQPGEGCKNLLFTLDYRVYGSETSKNKIEPTVVLDDLFVLSRNNYTGMPMRQAACRTYISMNAIFEGQTKRAEKICSTVN